MTPENKTKTLGFREFFSLMLVMIFVLLPLGITMIALSGKFIILPILDFIGK